MKLGTDRESPRCTTEHANGDHFVDVNTCVWDDTDAIGRPLFLASGGQPRSVGAIGKVVR